MGGGFGDTRTPKVKAGDGDGVSVRPQVKEVRHSDPCPCKSESAYGDCCDRFHKYKGSVLPSTVEEAVRARFSAYATGNSAYLVDSTHPRHKDYRRHADGGARNPQKARRNWERELVSQNSEAFEFLKLEIMDSPKAQVEQHGSEDLATGCETQSVSFRVLVRARGDGTIVPFQETATFAQMMPAQLAALDRPLAIQRGGSGSKASASGDLACLYVRGEVGVMDDQTTRRLVAEAPKYMSSSIRDQW
jgi:uncharacterized protein YchJ